MRPRPPHGRSDVAIVDELVGRLLNQNAPRPSGGIIRLIATAGETAGGSLVPYQQAGYTQTGPAPFVCGHCRHYEQGMCDLVRGPYEDGGVLEDDTCIYWQPCPAMTGAGPVPGEGEDEDSVPVMARDRKSVV